MGQRAQCWTKRKGLAREKSGKIKAREEQEGAGREEGGKPAPRQAGRQGHGCHLLAAPEARGAAGAAPSVETRLPATALPQLCHDT